MGEFKKPPTMEDMKRAFDAAERPLADYATKRAIQDIYATDYHVGASVVGWLVENGIVAGHVAAQAHLESFDY